jgi:renalase
MTNIAIIGAGLSGLTVANILKDHADITIFEKSRGVSGRMSTRHAYPYSFDHGAQFFKAKTDEFRKFINPMIKKGLIGLWNARFVEIKNRKITKERQWSNDYNHYVGVPSMNAIAKYLSQDIQVKLVTCVKYIRKQNCKWILKNEQGEDLGEFDWVILTAPAEQALNLIPSSLSLYSKVSLVKMQSCFSLMLGFQDSLAIDFDAALVRGEDISWISVNSSKPCRNQSFCLLVHSTNKWSDQHIDDDRNQVMNYLCQQTSKIIGHDVYKADHISLHSWHYANIQKQIGETYLIDPHENIGVCGDWLIQGRVESAFTSGYRLANKIIQEINFKR